MPGKLDGEANKLDTTAASDRHEFYGYRADTRGRVMFQRLQHMQQPQHGRLVASKPQLGKDLRDGRRSAAGPVGGAKAQSVIDQLV